MKPITKIKIYRVEDKIPKLHSHKGSRLLSSNDLIIYWQWEHFKSQVNKTETPRIGWYNKDENTGEIHWTILGITGNIKIIAWGYLKKLSL